MSQITAFAKQYSRVQDLLPADKKRLFFILAKQNNPELETLLALKEEVDNLIIQIIWHGWNNEVKVRLTSLPELAHKTSQIHPES